MIKNIKFKQYLKIFILVCVLFIVIVLISATIWHKVKPAPFYNQSFPSDQNNITWIGHSSILLHLKNINILLDPIFSDTIICLAKRYIAPGIILQNLPPIDIICISHEHLDHLDIPTLKKLRRNIKVVVAPHNVNRIKDIGFSDVYGLDRWESVTLSGVRITAVPAKHGTENPIGFVLEKEITIYFSGDTGYGSHLKEIGNKFKIDLAFLPISHYRFPCKISLINKYLKKIHLGPPDFPKAMKDLGAQYVIPIHWGTFRQLSILELPIDVPINHLKKIRKENHLEDKIIILEQGQQFFMKSVK